MLAEYLRFYFILPGYLLRQGQVYRKLSPVGGDIHGSKAAGCAPPPLYHIWRHTAHCAGQPGYLTQNVWLPHKLI